jgi:formamidopyrimidine-DNA glycosylase
MPELPEVETIRAQLAARLLGETITRVEAAEPFMLRDVSEENLRELLAGRQIDSVERKGKFLLIRLSGGLVLTIHLGMTGQLLILPDAAPLPSHARFVFGLSRSGRLVFRDIRKFGRLHLTPEEPPARLAPLGPDALVGAWDATQLARLLEGRRTPLKAFLLDQRRLAGIGNIYADEILWAARISPLRPAGLLSPEETERLAAEIRTRLAEGVRLRGCSISDFVDAAGSPGCMQEALNAYGRHGEPCPRCGAPLRRAIVAGRGTAFCPECQT